MKHVFLKHYFPETCVEREAGEGEKIFPLAISNYSFVISNSFLPYLSSMLLKSIVLRLNLSLSLSLSLILSLSSQSIELFNPSFEEEPQDATTPQGWTACKEGTTPDILPGFWGVYSLPSDGETYLGLITRLNNTWENIGQRLTAPLLKGTCYEWSLDLAHSETYSGYNGPIHLRVWISKLKCQKDQLIYESPLIEHQDWKTYKVKFVPNDEYRYILLEAFHSEAPFQYQGNILVDRLREIRICERT